MKKNFIKTLSLLLTLSALVVTPTFASTKNIETNKLVEMSLTPKLIDTKTNETVDSVTIKNIHDARTSKNSDGSITKSYNVDVTIPANAEIQTYDIGGGSISQASCTATLNITYFMNAAGDQIKITKISGEWIPESNLLIISNRVVGVTDGRGVFIQKELTKYPTSNTFSYSTGWGYVNYIGSTEYTGARGYIEATLKINGMGGSYDLFLPVGL